MKDIEDMPCNCKIDGKQYNENDKTCIECKRSQKILEVLFDLAFKMALDTGDISLLEMLIKNKGAKS